MRKLTIVFHDGGGGHRSTAEALKGALAAQASPWEVSLLNIQQLLDPLDVVHKFTGLRIQDAYNLLLRKGWTRLAPQLLVLLQTTIRIYHPWIVKALRGYWAEHPADLVLSVIPHFNSALAESIRATWAETPFVTLLTDLADYPPRFWIEPESEYVIAGSRRAREQALDMGHAEDRIFETSGMVLKPGFYKEIGVDRAVERSRLGLEAQRPTGVVLFGGHGSQAMVEITQRLIASDNEVQLILLCGHNQRLADALRALPRNKPMLVQGFTSTVEQYMALADFFIGKPGPGSISEALQFHLPVIVECNSKTLPQERYNAEWLKENGFGIVVSDFREIAASVKYLLQPATLDEFRARVNTYSNRALFEVPVILDKCLGDTQSGPLLMSEMVDVNCS